MKFYCENAETVISELSSDANGLTSGEAERRLAEHGKNKLAEGKKDSIIKQLLKQLADPMIIILLVAAAISGVLAVTQGESFADVIIILAVVVVNAVLGVYQENKAEKAIEALQEMSAATSKVLRDGKIVSVHSEELTIGDVVLLEAGDAVPADGRIIENASLKIEEAALTGESVPVSKFIDAINLTDSADVPLGDRKNMAYMGSTVVYGRGAMIVTAVGMQTEMGKIADALANAQEGQTPLQIKLTQLSKVLTWLVLGICAAVFAVQLIRAGGFDFETVLSSFMIAVSLAVAAIPEGLAAVVTVVLSIGVTNMSKRNAIIRKLTAVETLGCAQIICSDKTGTLTQNKMTVVDFFGEDKDLISKAMALCSDAEIDADGVVTGEPTEAALVVWANKLGHNKTALKEDFPRCGEAPFDSGRKMMSTVHLAHNGIVQYTKGAPDVIIDRCTHYMKNGEAVPMTEEYRQAIAEANKAMADKALRVLACAMRVWEREPDSLEPEELEHDLCFVGLTGMIDPVRPEVKAAIDECVGAGVRAVMITGDHIDTAVAIAKELGILRDGDRAITGSELSQMSDSEFEACFRDISVYARVQPEHKTRIVNAWRGAGYVTAMTGDGVNDAPALKQADIGVAMGVTGTEVAKDAAAMVLTDDNFATIVKAVANGRNLYKNIKNAIQFLLSGNFGAILAVLTASVTGLPVPFAPVHLLFINLLTDSLPAIALGVEPSDNEVMKDKPRAAKESILTGKFLSKIALDGLVIGAMTMIAFLTGYHQNGALLGSTYAFGTLCLTRLFHGFNCKSDHPVIFTKKFFNNKWLLGAFLLGAALITAVLTVPGLETVFKVETLSMAQLGTVYLYAFASLPIIQLLKWVRKE